MEVLGVFLFLVSFKGFVEGVDYLLVKLLVFIGYGGNCQFLKEVEIILNFRFY